MTSDRFARAHRQYEKQKCSDVANTTYNIVISWVLNGNYNLRLPKSLQALCMDERYCEGLLDILKQHAGPKEPYTLTSTLKYSLKQEELYKEYME